MPVETEPRGEGNSRTVFCDAILYRGIKVAPRFQQQDGS